MDKVIIKGLKVYAYHGVNPEEKIIGQNFIFDINLYTNLKKSGNTDCVEDTISYSRASKLVLNVARENKYNLLERLANRIAEELFKEFKSLKNVDISIKKPGAPMELNFDYMAVMISRERSDFDD